MVENNSAVMANICANLAAHSLPRWNELPDLPLYMDQVLELIGRYLDTYPGADDKGLTASMVNNYVKLGVMPPPIKKRYTREHLAHLIIICLLKPCLPIASVEKLISNELSFRSTEDVYDHFCDTFEQTNRIAAASVLNETDGSSPLFPVYRLALQAQAEQAMARKLFAVCFPPEEK